MTHSLFLIPRWKKSVCITCNYDNIYLSDLFIVFLILQKLKKWLRGKVQTPRTGYDFSKGCQSRDELVNILLFLISEWFCDMRAIQWINSGGNTDKRTQKERNDFRLRSYVSLGMCERPPSENNNESMIHHKGELLYIQRKYHTRLKGLIRMSEEPQQIFYRITARNGQTLSTY